MAQKVRICSEKYFDGAYFDGAGGNSVTYCPFDGAGGNFVT
jgi:hypothetical protein